MTEKIAILYGWDLTPLVQQEDLRLRFLNALAETAHIRADLPVEALHLYGQNVYLGVLMHETDLSVRNEHVLRRVLADYGAVDMELRAQLYQERTLLICGSKFCSVLIEALDSIGEHPGLALVRYDADQKNTAPESIV